MVISLFIVCFGLSSSMEGQAVSKIEKVLKPGDFTKARLINFNDIHYTATISTRYNQAGNIQSRGVYLRIYNGDWSEPETWLTDILKLYFNGVEITKKNSPSYFFDSNVSSLTSNLNVVIKHKTNNYSADVFTATGIETPVSMTFPTQGYVYKVGKRVKGKQLNQLKPMPVKRVGLKVAWTATTDDILVWLYHNGSVIKELTPLPGRNYVRFNQSLFQPGDNYTIRVRQQGPNLTLSGKYKSGSYIRNGYQIFCNISTE